MLPSRAAKILRIQLPISLCAWPPFKLIRAETPSALGILLFRGREPCRQEEKAQRFLTTLLLVQCKHPVADHDSVDADVHTVHVNYHEDH